MIRMPTGMYRSEVCILRGILRGVQMRRIHFLVLFAIRIWFPQFHVPMNLIAFFFSSKFVIYAVIKIWQFMTLCVSFDCICNYYFANVHTFLTYLQKL